jgi:hypothetical protein
MKSVTPKNEEKQLRLGMGQVLRYQQVLSLRFAGKSVIPVLASEREPKDPTWVTLCEAHGVRLVWPKIMASLFREAPVHPQPTA